MIKSLVFSYVDRPGKNGSNFPEDIRPGIPDHRGLGGFDVADINSN